MKVVNFFVRTITAGKGGVLSAQEFDFYLDYTMWDSERFDDEQSAQSERVCTVGAAHYVLDFLFDLLQFAF